MKILHELTYSLNASSTKSQDLCTSRKSYSKIYTERQTKEQQTRITNNFEKEESWRNNSTDDLLYSGIKNPKIEPHKHAQLNLDIRARQFSG